MLTKDGPEEAALSRLAYPSSFVFSNHNENNFRIKSIFLINQRLKGSGLHSAMIPSSGSHPCTGTPDTVVSIKMVGGFLSLYISVQMMG